ncbi:hypothetical protein [Thiolapillus sp.]|uniref:hypothetical protein n=1 Tax=Thiolapillus sp. TaxID=2017437 RepID=UPI0025D734DA|nr:hypothetical protein [Thiolapillus sp.]
MFSLWRKARRENSAASRLLGSTSLRFALHGWQRQSKIGPDQVDMGYAVAQGDGLEALFQPTVAIDDGAGYHQAGMGGVDFRVALLEDECHWQFTPWVKS